MLTPKHSSPYKYASNSVTSVMMWVVLALLPVIGVQTYIFGWGVVVNVLFTVAVALGVEGLMLAMRKRPIFPFLSDGSVVITAILLGLALPPLAPWWLMVVGISFAVIFAKHLYGGLGYNPFNPAMVAYAMLLVSFPLEMTMWFPPHELNNNPLNLIETITVIFTGQLPGQLSLDSLSMATPLDSLKTELGLDKSISQITTGNPLFGWFGGAGWEWVSFAALAGGCGLIYKKIISWHIPIAVIGSITLLSGVFYLIDAEQYASPLFHIFSGATLLGAFFIATDPVTASTTPVGRLIYGAGIGLLTYVIRTWGGYPDAIAFAVLLMNISAPTIDYYTRPRIFGYGDKK
ncbi:MAG: electron transport complex subunit RsxD [Gammaproteobacteria bacterium]|nr:electron transport complex subunit RsxD [Gammaproteobacteria bacterium]